MSRRLIKALALCLTLVMALGAFAGCSSSDGGSTAGDGAPEAQTPGDGSEGEEAPAGDGGYKDTIIIGENGEPKDLDPDGSWGATEARFSTHIHEGLVREDENGAIIPLLAESWEVSDDELTYTFQLKADVKFSDGTPVTGEDWIWSLERARDNPTSNSRTVASNIVSIEAPDDTTLVITLDAPTAPFIANLCKWNMVVKSKSHYEAIGEDAFQRDPLGTGPYKLVEWKQGEHLKFEANEYYHMEGKPYTKNLTYQIIADDNTRLLQLQAGQIDIAPGLPVNLMDQISGDPNLVDYSFEGAQVRYIIINATDEVLQDVNVRTALAYATNKQEILDLVASGHGRISTAFISFIHGELYNTDLAERGQDIEKAKELLAEAGYGDGLNLTMALYGGNLVYENIATILQAQWAQAGITLELSPLESATLLDSLDALNYQLTLLQWTDSTPDPSDIGAYECRYADSQQWYSGLQDQALEDLYLSTVSEMDTDKRKELFWELQEMVYDNCTIIPVFQADYTYGATAKVEGLEVTPFNKIDSASIRVRA